MAEFKLGRIRFIWKSNWVTGTTYIKDDVVRYGGKVYICLAGHTANADFYIDLENATPKWGQMSDGQAWRGDWATAQYYKENDLVKWGGLVYICTNGHTSSTYLETNQSDWNLFAESLDWKSTWATSTYYKVNDVVKYGGYTYLCITSHTSNASATLLSGGLEADQAKWQVIHPGLEYKGVFTGSARYKINDVVKFGPDLWICTTFYYAATNSFDESKWQLFVGGLEFEDTWNSSAIYQPGDVVTHSGYVWVAITNHTNSIPVAASSDWDLFTVGFKFAGDWNSYDDYLPGDVLRLGGYTYLCKVANANQQPPNLTYWEVLNTGFKWRSVYTNTTPYVLGDVVRQNANAYVCKLAHTSNTGVNDPATDSALPTSVYWDLLAGGPETNVLTTVGDLVYYGGGGPTRLPVGTDGQVLTVVNGIPSWNTFGDVPGVYYVASTGTDNAFGLYGLTLDKPFKTIRYALRQIEEGGRNINAAKLLELNRQFIQREIVEWTEEQILTNTAPFSTSFTYDTVKCERDMGYIIDAVIYDLTHGGNSRSRAAALAYVTSPGNFYILGQEAETVASIAYGLTVIEKVLGNLAPAVNYQALQTATCTNTLSGTNRITASAGTGGSTRFKVDDAVVFTGTTFGNIVSGTTYFINTIVNSTTFTITATKGSGTPFVLTTSSGTMTITTRQIAQVIDADYVAESGTYAVTTSLVTIVTNAITAGVSTNIPAQTKVHDTLFVKTGNYDEVLPLVIPARTSIVGDELRTTVIQPGTGTVHITDVAVSLDALNRIQTIISNVVQGVTVTPTAGNAESQVQAWPFGTSTQGTLAANLVTDIRNYINFHINAVGSDPTLTGTNTAVSSYDVYAAVRILERNKDFLANEATAFTNATYSWTASATDAATDQITVASTTGMTVNMAVRFTGTVFGGVALSTTYFIRTIGAGVITVSATRGGAALDLSTASGTMTVSYYYDQDLCKQDIRFYVESIKYDLVYTGNYKSLRAAKTYRRAQQGSVTENMFLARNGTTLRNMTFNGLTGTLGAVNVYGTSRPTAGAYVSLDPGYGVADTDVHITDKSPYVQNITTFGTACVGLKVDGSLHNAGNDSIVANDFTQVLSDGIGYWVTNNGRSELVSVFTYYNHIGYLAENGGKIRATNGNNSYGDFGSVSEGIDSTETAITATVNNRSLEAQVAFAFTNGSNILRLEYSNAGTTYTSAAYTFAGTGVNAAATADEFRDNAVFEARIVDLDSTNEGGANYKVASNTAQSGTATAITLSASDIESSPTYVGMAIYIQSGAGVGQFGYIFSYNSGTKVAQVYKMSTGTAGWDHVIPGTAIESTLDLTTNYIIEPRVTFTAPGFTATNATLTTAAAWSAVGFGGGRYIAVSSGATTTNISTNGTTWSSGGALPTSATWTDIQYGAADNIWVAVASGGTTAASSVDGSSWALQALPVSGTWVKVAYGNGRFVTIASGSTNTAYSDNGTTWFSGGALPTSTTWSSVTYGNGYFVAVATGGTATAVSVNGTSWALGGVLPSSTTWSSVAYGNGRFVATAGTGGASTAAAYSLDLGVTWTASTLPSSTTWARLAYGQGVFFVVASGGTSAASSPDGVTWTARTLATSTNWTDTVFGSISGAPKWVAVASGTTTGQAIDLGATTQGRAVVSAGQVAQIRITEPGSGYSSAPSITITDPNNTVEATFEVRTGDGVLANPSFSNRGTGYVTATSSVTGDGYADVFQIGAFLFINNVTNIPTNGSNVQFAGIDGVWYKLVARTEQAGSPGNYSFRIQVSPPIGIAESPAHGTAITMRIRFSQVRLTGHDFLDIGTGNQAETNYPGIPTQDPIPANETVDSGGGRVFYTSTDQDGNFRVGDLFSVEQATGSATLNADAFNLSGLQELQLGEIALGSSNTSIQEFSTDGTFAANSDFVVPTQKAIKSYIASQIGGGGSSIVANSLTVGNIYITGNSISTTSGAVDFTAPVNFVAGVRGTILALNYFLQ
jgi:hypothetical protein